MKVFTDIAQNGKSQTEVTSIATPAGKKYYNEGNLVAATQSVMGLLTASDKTKLDGIAAGANKTVVDTALSTSSANPVQNKIVTTALSGKAAAIHTHSYTDCVIGGGSEKKYIKSLGAKLPLVFGNVFHGLPASAVVIEKSTDSGSTWTDMGISDAVKRNLVSCIDASGIGFNIKSNVGTTYQFRVTIDVAAKGFYGQMDRIYMNVSTNGTDSCWCSVYTCEGGSTTYTLRGTYTVSGWSGWNSVPFNYVVFSSAYTGRVRYVRLVFGGNHASTTYSGLSLLQLFGTSCQKWGIPNQMNGTGVPYTVDPDLNTYFPALVKATGFSGPLTGNVTGNATTAGDGSMKLYAHYSNEVNFGGTSTVTEIHFGYRAMDSRPIPTAYWFGGGKAKVYAGDIQLGSGKKLYFGSTGYYIELVNGNLHTNVGLYSDTFISARGKDDSGSTGGATIPAMWNSLKTNTDDYAKYTIHPDHIPALEQSKINGLSGALAGKAAAGHTHTKSEITDFPTSLTNPYSLSVFGVSYDGSGAKTVDKTTLIGTLEAGTSDVTDGTQFVTSYASDNGFDETSYKNIPYKRKASCLYNYIKAKTDTLYVTALGTSGNYLTWKKGNTTSSITVPFATSATKLATARTINGTSFDGSAAITTAKWGTARNISIGDGTNTGTAVSVDGSAAVTLKLPGTIKAKFVSSTSSAATSFLMGDGSVTTKKNLTSVSHCGWTSTTADALLVPTMNTIACWNGAYNSSGSSNLTYCCKGAFGTFAAKSSLAFSELTSKPTTLSGYGITDALPLTGGTLTGPLTVTGISSTITRNFNYTNASYARDIISIQQDGSTRLGALAYLGNANNVFGYFYLGADAYNGSNNLRVYSDRAAWGDKTIYHAGNSNLSTVSWACSTLNASGLCTADGGFATGDQNITITHRTYNYGHFKFINTRFSASGGRADNVLAVYDESATKKWALGHYGSAATDTYIYLGYFAYNSTQNFRILPSGTAQAYALYANTTIAATGAISSSTGIWSSGYVSARGQDTSSDIALKKDFSPIKNALDYVRGTHYTRFRWKDGGGESIGIIAQEEEKREYGFLVRRHDDVGHLTYDYAASTALLGAALQEEDRKVEELKTRITELENEIKNLKLCR